MSVVNVSDLFKIQKAIEACNKVAQDIGLNGDPSKETRRVGSFLQEQLIIKLLRTLPGDVVRGDRDLVRQLIRNIVLSHTETTQTAVRPEPAESPDPSLRSRKRARRSSSKRIHLAKELRQ